MRLRIQKLRWYWLAVAVPFVVAACGRNPFQSVQVGSSQSDCGYVQNALGERISWKGADRVPLYLHESFPQQFIPSLQRAILVWETALGHPLFQIQSQVIKGPANPAQDGMSVVYYLNTWEPDRAFEQARTSVYWVGDQIREADIRINAYNFAFYQDTPLAATDVHMESLLVHELGHVLGLKHKDNVGSVMATYLTADTVRTTLASFDHQSLRCEY